MELPEELRLVILFVIAFLIGLFVLVIKPDYRIKTNLESNNRYLSELTQSEVSAHDEPEDTLDHLEF